MASLALDPRLAGVDFRRVLYLDTETTGLAGGTGTVPFLVGLAWFEERSLRVHQLFLRRLGEEAPMLRVLAERMAESSCLVTFNGKSFDWPLLRTRFVLNRVPVPAELPHLDLLHCARRVFKHRGSGDPAGAAGGADPRAPPRRRHGRGADPGPVFPLPSRWEQRGAHARAGAQRERSPAPGGAAGRAGAALPGEPLGGRGSRATCWASRAWPCAQATTSGPSPSLGPPRRGGGR